MSKIKAGVAYVDIRLGSAKPLVQAIKAEVEKAAATAGKSAGKKVTEGLTKNVDPSKATARVISNFEYMQARLANTFAKLGSNIAKPFKAGFNALTSGFQKVASVGQAGLGKIQALGQRFPKTFQLAVGAVNKFKSALGAVGSAGGAAVSAVGSVVSSIQSGMLKASNAVGRFGQKIGLLGFQIQSLGRTMTLAFTAPLVAVTGLAGAIGIKLASQIETATVVMTTKFGPAGKQFIKTLEEMASKSPVFDTASIIEYAQRFTSAGLNIKQTQDFLLAFSNIAQSAGVTSTDKMNLALEAFAQILSKGKVQSEELVQQLAESLPGAVAIAAEAMHTTAPKLLEDLKAGKVSAQDFVAAITKLGLTPKYAKPAAAAADTLAARWSQLKETFQTKLAQAILDNMPAIKQALQDVQPLIDAFAQSFAKHLPDAIKAVKDFIQWIKDLKDKWDGLSPSTQAFIKKLLLIAAIAGPIIAVLGGVISAIGGLAAGIAFLLDPIGLIILAIIAVIAVIPLLIKWFKNLYNSSAGFRDALAKIAEMGKRLGESLGKLLPPLLKDLKEAWDQVKKTFQDPTVQQVLKGIAYVIGALVIVAFAALFGVIKGFLGFLGPFIKAVASLISGIVKIIAGLLSFLYDLWTGNWSKLGKDLKLIWDGLWDAIVGTIVNLVKAIWGYVWGLVSGIVDFFKWLYDVLVGHSIIPDMVNAIIGWFKKLYNGFKDAFNAVAGVFTWFVNNVAAPFASSVKEKGQQVLDFFSALPGKIKGFFSSAGSFLYSIGQDIVNGLISGIKSIGSKVKDALVGLLPGPLKKFAGELGISSPSKVFKQFGVWTVQGYNQGIAAAAPSTADTMHKWAKSVANYNSMNGTMDAVGQNNVTSGPKAAINIENFNGGEDDPNKIAERFYFLITARGASV